MRSLVLFPGPLLVVTLPAKERPGLVSVFLLVGWLLQGAYWTAGYCWMLIGRQVIAKCLLVVK